MKRVAAVSVLALVLTACGDSALVEPTTATSQPSGLTSGTTVAPATTAAPATTSTQAGTPAPELAGTSWNVTEYRLPGGSITNVWKTEVTIAFHADRTFSGSSGCNTYGGEWDVAGGWDEFEDGVRDANDGQELVLTNLAWTEMACEDAAIMEQETEILDLLQNAGRWVLIRGSFHLRDAAGSFLFEAEPA